MGEFGGKQINNLYCQNKSNWRGDRLCGEEIEEHAQSLESLLVGGEYKAGRNESKKMVFSSVWQNVWQKQLLKQNICFCCSSRFSVWSLGFVNLSRTTWVEKYVAKLSTSRKTGSREKEGARNKMPPRPFLQWHLLQVGYFVLKFSQPHPNSTTRWGPRP